MGFSLDEVRRLTIGDFVAFTDVMFGEERRRKMARPATQGDIDAFMS